ncbi:antibiotic biosynthesis monooxygenase [Gemmatimonadetes bacterium T265]|nr:antibiotic biosynthesis monooxygenase [Gemmatimonadetes bacterium T265]
MTPLLARTWRGTTDAADADAYLAYLRATGLAAYAATPGNRGVFAFRRVADGRAEWLLVTLWDSLDAVRAFAGARAGDADPTRAVFYPEDDRFLTVRDDSATHYDVVYAGGAGE